MYGYDIIGNDGTELKIPSSSSSRPRRLSISQHKELSRINMMKKTSSGQNMMNNNNNRTNIMNTTNVQLPQSKRVEEVKENMNKLQSSMKQFEYDEVLQPLSISFKNMYMKLKSTGMKDCDGDDGR